MNIFLYDKYIQTWHEFGKKDEQVMDMNLIFQIYNNVSVTLPANDDENWPLLI